jgi:hypothetical protein
MLKRNEIAYTELTQNDREIELYPSIQTEIQAHEGECVFIK